MKSKDSSSNRKAYRIQCMRCGTKSTIWAAKPLAYCPTCGSSLNSTSSLSSGHDKETSKGSEGSMSIIQGQQPEAEKVLYSIGNYQVLQSIGKGGMGEVLLAYDTLCGRRIALKQIRKDLLSFKQVQKRFLKEARITSQLTHPAIIPIYSIHEDENHTYYTMPFVEGKTLKQILIEAKAQDKKGERQEHLTGAVPSTLRVFLAICQAIAYAHSKLVLHRDLKPENIIVGTFGEVLILDWGLAKLLTAPPQEDFENGKNPKYTLHHMTQAGKVVGTVSYMAPERALGQPATKETDIYSLGVILYQILTLKLPFRRGSLKEFRANMKNEVLLDPIEMAPYRDIPRELSQIALRCLAPNPQDRYHDVSSIIQDLENYIEGKGEWYKIAELELSKRSDWEFQELILVAEHTAITRTAEISEWVHLMFSKAPFSDNIKLEADIILEEQCLGIGFLFNIPETGDREHINDGYCLWISGDLSKPTKLLRNSIEVLSADEILLQKNKPYQITITKLGNTIKLIIDDVELFTYISRMPLLGTHVGILARDNYFRMDSLKVYVGSQNIMVNCLAVPDAFLAHKDYRKALSEYRRIAYAFAGRAEGREAILRGGITLLEEAKAVQAAELYDAALSEFEKLHTTAGAPLEYIGKALVYEELQDITEEIKCFELAYRRYPKHPLIHTLKEQVIFRLMESSQKDRKATYYFLLLALCHIPDALEIPGVKKLTNYLKLHWEPLKFAHPMHPIHPRTEDAKQDMILTLAFWLHTNYIFEEKMDQNDIFKPLLSLIVLQETALVHKILNTLPKSSFKRERAFLNPLLESDLEAAFELLPKDHPELLNLLLDRALDEGKTHLVYQHEDHQEQLLWALLQDHRFEDAMILIEKIPFPLLTEESSILHFLYGCYLYATEGAEIAQIHWSSVLDVPFPRSWTLGSHYLIGKLDPGWFKKAFDWERWQLNRQLALLESIKSKKIDNNLLQ